MPTHYVSLPTSGLQLLKDEVTTKISTYLLINGVELK
jgi:hypothetical protein